MGIVLKGKGNPDVTIYGNSKTGSLLLHFNVYVIWRYNTTIYLELSLYSVAVYILQQYMA